MHAVETEDMMANEGPGGTCKDTLKVHILGKREADKREKVADIDGHQCLVRFVPTVFKEY